MTDEFHKLMQNYVVKSGIDMSVLRGSEPRTQDAAHCFLTGINFSEFMDSATFLSALDKETENLQECFPDGSKHWGLARKCMNIFLRNSTYSYYLREKHGLKMIEALLEIPLDAHVAKGLQRDAKKYDFDAPPKWTTLIGLKQADSDFWQNTAKHIAEKMGVCRVHLDIWYWRAQSEA